MAQQDEIFESFISGSHADEKEVLVRAGQPEVPSDYHSSLVERLSTSLDWDFISRAAFKHGVLQWISRNVREFGKGIVDPAAIRKLEIANMALTARQQDLIGALVRLLESLGAQGIEALTFKGPALSALAYHDPVERFSMDVDVLVPKEALGQTVETMVRLGYEPAVSLDRLSAHVERKNSVTLLHQQGNVDLHWTLDDPPFRARMGDVWRDASVIKIGGTPVRTLNEEQHFKFLCFHGAKHAWARLCWIVDLSMFMRPPITLNLDRITVTSSADRNDRVVALGVVLLASLLPGKLPDSVKEWIDGQKTARRLAKQAAERLFEESSAVQFHLFRLATLQRPWDKLHFLGHRVRRHFTAPDRR